MSDEPKRNVCVICGRAFHTHDDFYHIGWIAEIGGFEEPQVVCGNPMCQKDPRFGDPHESYCLSCEAVVP